MIQIYYHIITNKKENVMAETNDSLIDQLKEKYDYKNPVVKMSEDLNASARYWSSVYKDYVISVFSDETNKNKGASHVLDEEIKWMIKDLKASGELSDKLKYTEMIIKRLEEAHEILESEEKSMRYPDIRNLKGEQISRALLCLEMYLNYLYQQKEMLEEMIKASGEFKRASLGSGLTAEEERLMNRLTKKRNETEKHFRKIYLKRYNTLKNKFGLDDELYRQCKVMKNTISALVNKEKNEEFSFKKSSGKNAAVICTELVVQDKKWLEELRKLSYAQIEDRQKKAKQEMAEEVKKREEARKKHAEQKRKLAEKDTETKRKANRANILDVLDDIEEDLKGLK